MESFLYDVSTALTERERAVVPINNISAPPIGITKARVLCRVYSKRGFNPNQLKNFLLKHWLGRFAVTISDYDSESYMVTFGCEGDMRRVLSKEPWHFHNQHLILCPPSVLLSDSVTSYTTTPFWVQVFRLPFLSKSEALAKIIGNLIGEYLEVHNDSLNEGWGPFLRIQVGLDVSKPLLRGQMVSLPWMRDELWIEYRYERLPNFCYECGIIGHVYDNCTLYMEKLDEGIEPGLEYGPWMEHHQPNYFSSFSTPAIPPTVTSREKCSILEVSAPVTNGSSHQQTVLHTTSAGSLKSPQMNSLSSSTINGEEGIAPVISTPVKSGALQHQSPITITSTNPTQFTPNSKQPPLTSSAICKSSTVVKQQFLQNDHGVLDNIKGKGIVDDVPQQLHSTFQQSPYGGQASSSSKTIFMKETNEYPPGYLPKRTVALPVATPPAYLHHLTSASTTIPPSKAVKVTPSMASSVTPNLATLGAEIATENSPLTAKNPCTFTKHQMINQGGNVRQVLKRCRTRDTTLTDITNTPQRQLPEPISELAAISLVEEDGDVSLAKAVSQPRQSP
uniref:CCHC-type domain-containing protein n=1 Tax=Cannabis sativa TaxID=3483 RepID=A0A803NKW5_CANSA